MDPFELFALLFQSGPVTPDAAFAQAFAFWLLVALLLSRLIAGPTVYLAARKRPSGREVWWGALAALLPTVGVIAFFVACPQVKGPVVASWNPWMMCPFCGAPRGYSPEPCPRCGRMLAPTNPMPGPQAYAPPSLPAAPTATAVASQPAALALAGPPPPPPPSAPPYAQWPGYFPPPPPPPPVGMAPYFFAPRSEKPPAKAIDITSGQVVGAALFTFILAGVAVYLLLMPALISPAVSQQDLINLEGEPWFVLFELIVQDSILVAIAYDQGVFRKRLTKEEIGLRVDPAAGRVPKQVGIGVLAGAGTFMLSVVTIQILIDALTMSGVNLGGAGPALQPRIASLNDYGFWLVSGVVIAPIAEEFFFRGYALGGFVKRGLTNRGLLVTSALFAAVHMDPFSFGPLFVAGMVLGILRVKTNSLAAPIAAHATNNFIVMTLTLFGL